MAIKEVQRSIAFTPYVPRKGRIKDDSPAPTVTINFKGNKIIFGSKILRSLNMQDKFVSFYYEPTRRIIGWRIVDKLSDGQLHGKYEKWKLVKTYGKGTGFWTTNIKGILEQFRGMKHEVYKDLEVQKYVEKEGVIQRGESYYFVQLKDELEPKDYLVKDK